jgi:magnesium-protoporphyrin O-methyltransferase
MATTCCHSKSAGKLFSLFARGSRKRLEKKGFERSQKNLVEGLNQVGFDNATLLEIGCGVGYLHQSLLEQGASTAVGIDLAPRMLSEAESRAAERQLTGRVSYLEGDFLEIDFLEIGASASEADVCILDKVVCCYPDAESLLHKSLAKTKQTYALTYPRNRWFVRLWTRLWNVVLWVLRSDFRTFVHDPVQVERWIVEAGFDKCFEDTTTVWVSQVYSRSS